MLSLKFSNYTKEVGCDEAGRGCLAGPVTAAAIILPESFKIDFLNDSKQLSEKKRDTLRPTIENSAISFAVTHILNQEIDEINILNASMKAMQESILKLNEKPDFIIIDGNRPLLGKLGIKTQSGYNLTNEEILFLKSIPNQSIVKGDSKFMSIAAASILAKTYRDEYMSKIHEEFPMYNWKKNKGYPTKDHREAIAKYGITKYHRKSFKLLPEQFVLDL
ncbi:ribonuclease HII [Flavobacterium oreochromis]|uniref:Ribonuclease HII n=2 Tax=Flavobacterium TaxID=237 RepID=A0A2D0AI12_9FLAO|nr:ribonuclease HII [Flavobacterium oreochromis]OWP77124.1 ribonuclease HII [Flavobacterium oreochromis]OWP79456.1 ribonuclease HII [Flavobacterium oreochromis]POR27602.1 ribonuclease HII [Flavobacterium columnare]